LDFTRLLSKNKAILETTKTCEIKRETAITNAEYAFLSKLLLLSFNRKKFKLNQRTVKNPIIKRCILISLG